MKKRIKKQTEPTPKYDSERETRALLEELGSDVKKIAEQVSSNSAKLKKLDKIESDLNEVKSELSTVKMAVMDNSQHIKKLESGQEKLETGQKEIKQKLDTAIAGHEQRLQKLEAV